MKYFKLFSIVLCLVTNLVIAQNSQLPIGYLSTNKTKTNINNGWKFHLDTPVGDPTKENYDDSDWEKVSIPHTLKLVSFSLDSVKETWVQEKYLRKIGWYRKVIKVNAKSTEKVYLEFEGIHNATELWVNGNKVGNYAINGYIPFHFDITNYVKFGKENIIVVKADNRFSKTIAPDPHRTDYVKFGGIYRDVYLVTKNKLHVTFNWEKYDAGVHITTPTVNKNNGTVSIKTTVANDNKKAKNCKIETLIIDSDGFVLKKITSKAFILPNTTHTFRQSSIIEDNYNLWSPNSPYLYRAHSIIYDDEKPVDFIENTFGFRTFKLVDGKGFVLNGEPIFLVGGNRHQSYPIIGDAVPNSFHYNEALQYKEAGMNIIRLSHYTQDDSFLQACDELGIIVYEEPSTWIEWGGDKWFDKLEEATRVMIRNHRNHPSIVFWGAGINHRGPVPRMQTVAKEEDPFRITASASSPWNGVLNEGITDVYATMDYRRTDFPESAFSMVMEHGSSPNSEVNQFHISRYKTRKNNIAAITWLGADYNHLQPDIVDDQWSRDFMTTYGVLTPYRIPKPVYFWYKSELVEKPIVHIVDETASKDGKVRVFSNCQEIELYHNGKLLERRKADNDIQRINLKHPSFTFLFNWKEGELKAIGYNNGIKVTDFKRHKEQNPYQIKVAYNINNQPFYAGGSDLRLAHAYILDKNGEVVTSAKQKVEFSISGNGVLVDNGKVDVNPAIVYDGVASIYVRPKSKSGKITITAKANGLKTGSASITTVPFNTNEILTNSKPIYNYPTAYIDLGGKEQYVQFDWDGWTNTSTFNLSNFEAKLKLESSNGDLNWLGSGSVMLGDLSFMGADGVYNEEGDLKLTLTNLKKGVYYIETYHHSRRNVGKLTNNIEVKINDKEGEIVKMADDHIVNYYHKDSSGERKPLHIKSMFKSDGKNPIFIEFKNLDKGDMWLNGIVLKQKK